jgi:hypothetical protein
MVERQGHAYGGGENCETAMIYADFVFATLLLLGATPESLESKQEMTHWRAGRNDGDKHGPGKHGVVSVDYLGTTRLAPGMGLKPYFAFGASNDGMRYLGVGTYKRLAWGPFEVLPSAGPVLYDSRGSDGTSERLQFRTGIEVLAPLSPRLALGVGFYHLSNANLTRDTAGVDVTYASLRLRL